MVFYGIVLGLILMIGLIIKSPQFKGWVGELQVNLAARFLLDSKTYRLVKNVTLPAGEGTTQIDHIIVSPFGIFVVETKNMRGVIYGKERDARWTQVFNRRSRFAIQNPLRQNYKHTKALSEILGLPEEKFKPLVVFVGDARLKGEMPENVTITGGYIRYIRRQNERLLDDEQIETILATIAEKRLAPGLRTHVTHVRHVKELVAAREQKRTRRAPEPPATTHTEASAASETAVEHVCPKCGKPMALRETKRGANAGKKFWGCTGFPACRMILPCESA